MADDPWETEFAAYESMLGNRPVMQGMPVTYPTQYQSDKSRARAAAYGTPEPPLDPTPAWMGLVPVTGPFGRVAGPALGALSPRVAGAFFGGQVLASPSSAGEPAPAGSPQAAGTILGGALEYPIVSPYGAAKWAALGAGAGAAGYGAVKAGQATGNAIRRMRESAAAAKTKSVADADQQLARALFNETRQRYTQARARKDEQNALRSIMEAAKNPTRSDNAIAYDPMATVSAASRGMVPQGIPGAPTAAQRYGVNAYVTPEAQAFPIDPAAAARTRVMADEFDAMTSAQRVARNNAPPAAQNDVFGAIDDYLRMPGADRSFLRDPVSVARAIAARTQQPMPVIVNALRSYDLRHGNRSNWAQYQGRPGAGRINPATGEVDERAIELAAQLRRIQDEQFAARGYFDAPAGASWENAAPRAVNPMAGREEF